MRNSEDAMRELLYDFRRYFEQLKEEGVERIETTHLPASGKKTAALKKPVSDKRPPQSTIKSTPVFPSGRSGKIQEDVEPLAASGTKSTSPAECFRILTERINNCHNCGLSTTRNCAVPGEGGNGLRILFVGEGPGAEEDRQGRPFVGRSGQLLDKILAAVSLTRKVIERTNNFHNCGLSTTRNCAVPGEGGNDLRILLVGEGPGAEEDRTGRPFVGRSGQLLDKILASVSLIRKDIFITNIVKCRPPLLEGSGAGFMTITEFRSFLHIIPPICFVPIRWRTGRRSGMI